MRVFFSPIDGLTKDIKYKFDNDVLEVTINGISDTFDFTSLPDGNLDLESIETTLEIQPISLAERVDGILYLRVLNGITQDATEFEKFPNWIEVGEDNGEV